MNKMQHGKTKPDHEGNIITHSQKWQELELQIWKVTSGVLHIPIPYRGMERSGRYPLSTLPVL